MAGGASSVRVDRTDLARYALHGRSSHLGSCLYVAVIASRCRVTAQANGIVTAQAGVGVAVRIMAGETRQRAAFLVAGASRQSHPLKTRYIRFGMRIAFRGVFSSAMTISANGIDTLRRGAVQIFHAVSVMLA